MRKTLITLLLAFGTLQQVFATHISGGEVTYTYAGAGDAANSSRYQVTLRLYKDFFSTSQVMLTSESPAIGIYRSNNLTLYSSLSLRFQNITNLNNTPDGNPCLSSPVDVRYEIATYTGTISLPNTADGYTIIWQRYTRVDLINTNPSSALGATFLTKIPGTNELPTGNNTCPQFVVKDTAVICKSTNFTLDFSATDGENDSLAYKFTAAYNGASGSANNPSPNPPATYTLLPVNYVSPYDGSSPLGSAVSIDVNTGLISGVAPATLGKYVICVMVEEWRSGRLINTHRKDFIVNIANCSLNGAQLSPDVFSCDGFTWTFENQSLNSNIVSYLWTFGDGNTSTLPRPTHRYNDSGLYNVQLKVVSTGGCLDSAKQKMHVYPGFQADFTASGFCQDAPVIFKDVSRSQYGTVNSWKWDFGDGATQTDISTRTNPTWTYGAVGTYTVGLIVTNSKGCTDSIYQKVTTTPIPNLQLPFRDTLICSIDTLPLRSTGNFADGVFSWSPDYRISSTSIPNPLVNPLFTTTYTVSFSHGGCTIRDSIKVNVLDSITVDAGADTTICRTDGITLRPVSQGLGYRWSPPATLSNPFIKFPTATPTAVSTTYFVLANLGKCLATDSITVTTVPYPVVNAGPDTTICFNNKATLHGTTDGSTSAWSPYWLVTNVATLTTTALPRSTTPYVLTVTDTLGCPKPSRDTVRVTVLPQPRVFAGNDTAIVIGQPLQMQTTISPFLTSYTWTPATGLNSSSAMNPIATISEGLFPASGQIVYSIRATSPEGCTASDDLVVKIFRTGPSIFVPNAFTPNGDGNNDIFKPVLAGVQRLDLFSIYNRYGQLMYTTSAIGQGWDGTLKGSPQGSSGYVYMVQAVDYTGKVIRQSGSFLLIR